nr:shikimate dehydrogenase [Variibacter gotjawalensis]
MASENAPVLVGLIGSGIQASLTPAMHEQEGRAQGLDYSYGLIDLDVLGVGIEALPELLQQAERGGFRGLNITYPCKQAVIQHLDELDAEATLIGAVNTVVFRGNRRIGHNTDWFGFAQSFRHEFGDVPREHVVLLGAGGAGAAVAHALLKSGVRQLTVVDTLPERATSLAAELGARFADTRVDALLRVEETSDIDGIVNATPVGMAKLPGLPIGANLVVPSSWVADVIYFPRETELLQLARARGCRTMSGAGMAVHQAAEAFHLFTGRIADAERMHRVFESAI